MRWDESRPFAAPPGVTVRKLLGRLASIAVACALVAGVASAYTFTSADGKFTVEFPAAPKFAKSTSKTESGTAYDQYMWSVEKEDGWWGVAMIVYSKAVVKDYDASTRGAVAATKGTLLSQKPIRQSGVDGREIMIDVPQSGVVRQRFLWIGERFYQVVFSGKPGSGTTPDVDAFLNSFRTVK